MKIPNKSARMSSLMGTYLHTPSYNPARKNA